MDELKMCNFKQSHQYYKEKISWYPSNVEPSL